MGQLKDQISKEIITAMKAQDKVRLNVLRYLKKLFIENDTSNKPIDEMDIVISYAKKVKESLSMFPENGAQYNEVLAEVKILEEYLPKALSDEEVKALINEIKGKLEVPNLGAIMKELSPLIKGRFDGKKATDFIKAALS